MLILCWFYVDFPCLALLNWLLRLGFREFLLVGFLSNPSRDSIVFSFTSFQPFLGMTTSPSELAEFWRSFGKSCLKTDGGSLKTISGCFFILFFSDDLYFGGSGGLIRMEFSYGDRLFCLVGDSS